MAGHTHVFWNGYTFLLCVLVYVTISKVVVKYFLQVCILLC